MILCPSTYEPTIYGAMPHKHVNPILFNRLLMWHSGTNPEIFFDGGTKEKYKYIIHKKKFYITTQVY